MNVCIFLIDESSIRLISPSAAVEPAQEAARAAGLVHRLLLVRLEGIDLSVVQLLQSLQINSLDTIIIFFIVLNIILFVLNTFWTFYRLEPLVDHHCHGEEVRNSFSLMF